MHTSFHRSVTGAMAALALSLPAPAIAQQATTPPSVVVSGVVYSQYLYQLKDSAGAGNQNQFSIQRAYVNVIGRFGGTVLTRLTADIAPTGAAASQPYRLKYAYGAWTPEGSVLTYKFGMLQTPFIEWEETLWDYRVQGTMALDRNKYMSSADFGAGIDAKWGADAINGQVAIVNGETYSGGTGDSHKDIEARLSVRVMDTDDSSRVGGLRVTGYAGIGKATGGGDRNRYLGVASYRSKQLTLAGEFVSTKDALSPAGGGANATGQVISAFGVFHVPQSQITLLGRVDLVDPNTATANDRMTRIIAGLSYQLTPNLRVLADVDNLTYQATPTVLQDATRSQALFQAQISF